MADERKLNGSPSINKEYYYYYYYYYYCNGVTIDNLFFLHFMVLILPCGCDNFKRFPCIQLKFVLRVTNSSNQFFNNGCKQDKNGRFIVIFRF